MENIGRFLRSGIGLALVTALAVPLASWAQAGKGKSEARKFETEIEEITVTAQKREENIQEIPISVTAITAATLRQKGATSILDLVQSVPNFYPAAATAGASTMGLAMRGTAATNPNAFEQNSTVGLYIDGAYIAKIQGSNFDLEDLARVEVLRGPQGTLYGRNTIGGALNIITTKPTEERSITAATEVGNYNAFKGRLTLNVPLIGKNGFFQSDVLGTLSLRENIVYTSHDGFWQNRSPTAVKASGPGDLSDLNRVLNMTSVRWQPRSDVTVDYSFEYHRFRESPSAAQVTFIYPKSPVSAGPLDLHPYQRTNRVDSIGNNMLLRSDLKTQNRFNDDGNNRMHILTGAWDVGPLGPLGNVTLKSISLYRAFSGDGDSDLDGSPLHITDFHSHGNLDHWSEEVQWIGSGPRIHYVMGGYYYGEHSTQVNSQLFFGGASNLYQVNTNKNSSYAAFGQLTWTPPILNDRLSVTGGMRYTEDHIHTTRNWQNLRNPSLNWVASVGKGYGGSDAISPLGDISYQWTDNLMTYFRVSRGFQSGVSNAQASDPRLFKAIDPEKLLAYEAGFKSQWLDNRLRFNADGFFSDYTDRVVNTFRASASGGTSSTQENAGKEEVWGSEVEVALIPVRGLEATANYSYLDPKFTEFLSAKFDASGKPVFDESGKPVMENVADKRDVQLAPHNTVSLGLTYTAPPTSTGVFSAHVDMYWQDNVVFQVNQPHQGAGWSYAVVNGRLQFVDIPLQAGTLDLAVFGRNLSDEKYRTWAIDFGQSLGWAINTFGAPRTFGLQMTYNFTAGEAAPPPPAPVAQAAPPPPPPAKKKIVLRSVHFDFDKATLKADAKPILDEAIQVLKQEGSVDIVVEGHTDSVGTDQYNLGLSRRRADTVRHYLIEHGVAASRITAEGMGESKPVASNETADGRAQNRRVELHVK